MQEIKYMCIGRIVVPNQVDRNEGRLFDKSQDALVWLQNNPSFTYCGKWEMTDGDPKTWTPIVESKDLM